MQNKLIKISIIPIMFLSFSYADTGSGKIDNSNSNNKSITKEAPEMLYDQSKTIDTDEYNITIVDGGKKTIDDFNDNSILIIRQRYPNLILN